MFLYFFLLVNGFIRTEIHTISIYIINNCVRRFLPALSSLELRLSEIKYMAIIVQSSFIPAASKLTPFLPEIFYRRNSFLLLSYSPYKLKTQICYHPMLVLSFCTPGAKGLPAILLPLTKLVQIPPRYPLGRSRALGTAIFLSPLFLLFARFGICYTVHPLRPSGCTSSSGSCSLPAEVQVSCRVSAWTLVPGSSQLPLHGLMDLEPPLS